MLADKLEESLGQPVVVENRVGAGGRIAAEAPTATAAHKRAGVFFGQW